jgi:8-oxo-dGTP pyrophosphatase MutT (NUDIX family)
MTAEEKPTMFSNYDMHFIQKDIIQSLAFKSPQRFSQLQPATIPNNTFSYHLKRLVDLGYIESKEEKGYVATRKALKTIQFSPERTRKQLTPATITIIYVTNDIGEVLILNRSKHPFIDYFGLPSGLVHSSETVEVAAHRELYEKTGIDATQPLNYAGVLDFQYVEQGSKDIFVHAIGFIYTYSYGDKPLPKMKNSYGTLSWSGLTREKILPEVYTVHDLVDKPPTLTSVSYTEPR